MTRRSVGRMFVLSGVFAVGTGLLTGDARVFGQGTNKMACTKVYQCKMGDTYKDGSNNILCTFDGKNSIKQCQDDSSGTACPPLDETIFCGGKDPMSNPCTYSEPLGCAK